jgi:hypothetical protein
MPHTFTVLGMSVASKRSSPSAALETLDQRAIDQSVAGDR